MVQTQTYQDKSFHLNSQIKQGEATKRPIITLQRSNLVEIIYKTIIIRRLSKYGLYGRVAEFKVIVEKSHKRPRLQCATNYAGEKMRSNV